MDEFEIILNGYLAEDYKTKTNTESGPRLLIIIWPSTGGNARSFRIKESELISQKILLIRYNPTSHGNSFGNYNPASSIKMLTEFLRSNSLHEIPVIGIGHSGGGAALIMMENEIQFVKLYLLSPILDSRLSLEYLYKNGNINEFLELLVSDPDDAAHAIVKEEKDLIFSCLSNPSWLQSKQIESLNFPVSNPRIHLDNLSTFLTNLFLPGFRVTEQLLNIGSPIEIFLPMQDNWFPREETLSLRYLAGLKITEIESAKDHFFTSAWLAVWQKIRNEIYT